MFPAQDCRQESGRHRRAPTCSPHTPNIATDLIVNIAAIFLLAYVLYFRRHRRADLLLAYVALNIGIFVAISLLTTVRVDIALGFGLFAILSIIRLRSSTVTQQEVAYYFVALVMGLVNGMDIPRPPARRADQRGAAGRDGDRRQQGAARAHPAHGRPPGRGARRRRLAGRGPGAAPGRHRAAPRGQRRRLRPQDDAGRRAVPGRSGTPRRCPRTSGSWTSRWTWSTPTTPRWSPTSSAGSAGRCWCTASRTSTTCATPWRSRCATASGRRSRRTLNGHHINGHDVTGRGYDEQNAAVRS